ncbi:hypothetical protein NFI96_003425 [Prochilodus magdalenae]|nr:hypothetical protein NFI96_003425 [Prochilodus magdalenae]
MSRTQRLRCEDLTPCCSPFSSPPVMLLLSDSLVPVQCTCWAGFRLKEDGRTCVDVDECVETYPCSQQCINTYGSYKCLCVDGYHAVEADPHSCRAVTAEEPFLILADHHEIRKISLDGSNYTLLKQVGVLLHHLSISSTPGQRYRQMGGGSLL